MSRGGELYAEGSLDSLRSRSPSACTPAPHEETLGRQGRSHGGAPPIRSSYVGSRRATKPVSDGSMTSNPYESSSSRTAPEASRPMTSIREAADRGCTGRDAPRRCRTFVKRIIGLPGEAVSMRAGHVFIDGARLAEPYLRSAYRGEESGSWGRSPRDRYFVLGDNRAMSCDSRRWGTVPRGSIIGRADLTYWPQRNSARRSADTCRARSRTLAQAAARARGRFDIFRSRRGGPSSATQHERTKLSSLSPTSRAGKPSSAARRFVQAG